MAPTQEQTTKRPSMTSRSSSGSVRFSQSPVETLSTSAQRQRASRHVVGQTRLGPRVPSYSRNVNKLTKLTPAHENHTTTKNGQPRRNLSNLQQLTQNNSSTALRKNHSETSLKKNRSSGQLTKLTRPNSSRSALKAGRPGSGKKRTSSQNAKLPDGHTNPTVRFNLGDGDEEEDDGDGDDGWVDSVTHSESTTRSNTRRNSMINSQDALENGSQRNNGGPGDTNNTEVYPQLPPPSRSEPYPGKSKSTPSFSQASTLQNSHPPEADRITSKLLKRNTSFTAAPKVSSVAATQISGVSSQAGTLIDHYDDREALNRFIEPSKLSTGITRESNFLPRHTHERLKAMEETSTGSLNGHDALQMGQRQMSQSSQIHSGTATPNAAVPLSRTQQKLLLERASADIKPQHTQLPIGLLRTNRLSTASLPYFATATDGEGRLNPQMRQLFEQSDMEYRQIRVFQNPLADAIKKLQESGVVLQGNPGAKKTETKPGQQDLKSHAKSNQSQTNSPARTNKSGGDEGDVRRHKVVFQGVKEKEGDAEGRPSMEEEDAEREATKARKAEAREICKRMWDLSVVSNE